MSLRGLRIIPRLCGWLPELRSAARTEAQGKESLEQQAWRSLTDPAQGVLLSAPVPLLHCSGLLQEGSSRPKE